MISFRLGFRRCPMGHIVGANKKECVPHKMATEPLSDEERLDLAIAAIGPKIYGAITSTITDKALQDGLVDIIANEMAEMSDRFRAEALVWESEAEEG